jgi:hypothetical protein
LRGMDTSCTLTSRQVQAGIAGVAFILGFPRRAVGTPV